MRVKRQGHSEGSKVHPRVWVWVSQKRVAGNKTYPGVGQGSSGGGTAGGPGVWITWWLSSYSAKVANGPSCVA